MRGMSTSLLNRPFSNSAHWLLWFQSWRAAQSRWGGPDADAVARCDGHDACSLV